MGFRDPWLLNAFHAEIACLRAWPNSVSQLGNEPCCVGNRLPACAVGTGEKLVYFGGDRRHFPMGAPPMGHGEEQQGRSRAASPLRLDGCVPATAPPPGPIEQAPVVEKRGKGATRVEEEQGRSRAAAPPPAPSRRRVPAAAPPPRPGREGYGPSQAAGLQKHPKAHTPSSKRPRRGGFPFTHDGGAIPTNQSTRSVLFAQFD